MDANLKARASAILDALEEDLKGAAIALHFTNPLELLIATILSAQCTDKRVNEVTPPLFKQFRTASDYARADKDRLEEMIRPTGFYRNKAKAIIGCCAMIVSDFGGEVPDTVKALTALPGVGRKTANVVLGSAFGQAAIAVDTHVKRVANRLGLTQESNPDRIETDLQKIIPKGRWTRTTLTFILHGRKTCVARKPKCGSCAVSSLCDYFMDELREG
ncbi:MAG: endonuclease III [Deltaproteobacteria bacterium]|nr:endonuclease III [Deltaproteobacteria bacterium]